MIVEKVMIEGDQVTLEISLDESSISGEKKLVIKVSKAMYQRMGSPKLGNEMSDNITGVPPYWRAE